MSKHYMEVRIDLDKAVSVFQSLLASNIDFSTGKAGQVFGHTLLDMMFKAAVVSIDNQHLAQLIQEICRIEYTEDN